MLTGLMVSGRNASGMASELGSMKVTEQIDAMRALGTDPLRKLVTPRLVATVFMLFFLTILSDAVGIAGGALVCVFMLGLNGTSYLTTSYQGLVYGDVVQGLTKPIFSGFIIATVGCYFGMNTKRRHPGRRPRHHPGRRLLLRLHHHRRLPRHPPHDRHLRQLTLCPNPSPAASSRRNPPKTAAPSSSSTTSPSLSTDKPLLKDISFTVDRGQTLIILGPAGTGKSVLMKLVNGLLRPDSGTITVFGENVTAMPERDLFNLRQRIGMVFQESALFDSMNVEDNVAYRLNEERMPADESHTKVEEVLNFVELPTAIAKFPAELSGGMRRRVSIARAIITAPDLILYDSPTGGLDPITSTTIIELVVKQRDVSHTTSLLITHRLQDAFTLATHCWNTEENKMDPDPRRRGSTTPPASSSSTRAPSSSTATLTTWSTLRTPGSRNTSPDVARFSSPVVCTGPYSVDCTAAAERTSVR